MKTFAQIAAEFGAEAQALLGMHDEKKLDDLLAFSGVETLDELKKVIAEDDKLRAEILSDAEKVFTQLRAYIGSFYGHIPVERYRFMYDLANSVGEHQTPIACDTLYPKDLPDTCDVRAFVRACDRETFVRTYVLIPRMRMESNPITLYTYEWIEGNLRSILRVCRILENGGATLPGFAVGNVYGGGEHCVIDGVVDDSLEGNRANIAKHLR